MSTINNLTTFLTGIADKLRTLHEKTDSISPQDFRSQLEDPALVEHNIVNGKTIFGTTGTYVPKPEYSRLAFTHGDYGSVGKVKVHAYTTNNKSSHAEAAVDNVTEDNIKKGVKILQVTGTCTESDTTLPLASAKITQDGWDGLSTTAYCINEHGDWGQVTGSYAQIKYARLPQNYLYISANAKITGVNTNGNANTQYYTNDKEVFVWSTTSDSIHVTLSHDHEASGENTKVEITEGTCTTTGSKKVTYECGYSTRESTGYSHDTYGSDVYATCTEDGYRLVRCSNCSYSVKYARPETLGYATGHSYETIPAVHGDGTCVSPNTTAGSKCSKCGEYGVKPVTTANHNFVNNRCTLCGIAAV